MGFTPVFYGIHICILQCSIEVKCVYRKEKDECVLILYLDVQLLDQSSSLCFVISGTFTDMLLIIVHVKNA